MKKIPLDTTNEGFIYLASPYSDSNADVMYLRFKQSCIAGAKLFKKGVVLFAPIAQSAMLVEHGDLGGTDWKTWASFDTTIIRQCKAVYVLTLDGWQESIGVTAEIVYAISEQIPVYYLDYETLELTRECE